MSRKVFKTEINPFMGNPFLMYLETPLLEDIQANPRCRIPMTLHLSENGTDDNLGCYVLGILDRKGSVHQTLLNGNQELLDVTNRLSYLLTKKYQVVTYVSISGNFTDDSIRDVILEIGKVLGDGRKSTPNCS